MKKFTSITIFLFLSLTTVGQNNKISKSEKSTLFEDKIESLEKSIIKNDFELEKIELKIQYVNENIQERSSHLEIEINNRIDDLDSKYNNYLIFGGFILAISVFLINYFGRKMINEKVEKLIEITASEYAEKKTDEVLKKYIDDGKINAVIKKNGEPVLIEILTQLEKRGNSTIDGIKVRGEEVISSMLAKQEDSNINLSEVETDEQILNANKESRVREFFELAMSRKDPLVQIELYKNVLKIEPEHLEALNNIAVSYNNAYNYDKAIEHLDKCIELSSEYALAYANRAHSYNLINELDKAIKDVNKAIELNPKLDWNYSVKGNILTKLGKLEEAETTFGLAIEINPNSPEAYFSRGFFYEEIKEYEKSELDYIKSEKLGLVNKASLFNNFAVLYRRQKHFDKAIEYLDKARKENPNYPNIDGTLALIYADKGEDENFYKYLLVALEKGCPVWTYLNDPGFNKYREQEKLKLLIESYKKKYVV